jgi:6-phosphofructokinase 1
MRIGVLTGGGDCPGLNQAIRGIIYRSLDFNDEVIGILDGWKGLIKGETKPLNLSDVEELTNAAGTIIFTSRTNPLKKEEDVKKVLHNFQNLKLDCLIVIGGEDTLSVACELNKKGVPCIGVPKTMDNDLSATDYTFGFDTSVSIAIEALERLRDTGKSHRRVMVLEVMGRHAGWVALFTGIGGGADWILIPEEKPDLKSMIEHIKKVYARKKYALVVVSEGIEIPEIEKMKEKEEKDEFGHMLLKKRGVGEIIAEIIERETKLETRCAVIGHMQRGGAPTLFDRMLAYRTGVRAVELAHERKFGEMVALKGNKIVNVPLAEATGKLKTVDKHWWNFAKIFFK